MNEQKNLLLAIVSSLLILLIFQYFFPNKPDDKKLEGSKINIENNLVTAQEKILPREKIVTNDNRVFISKESRLKGSLSLIGARFDDVILKDYNSTLSENSELVTIFSPRETLSPYFAEFGWVAKNNNTDVPQSDTLWKIKNGKELDINKPLTLEWVSPDGFTFTRIISLDANYMFTIEQKIKNNSSKMQSFIPYGRVNRTGTPETSGFYILHEGPIAVLNERLIEIDYDDLLDKKSTRNISQGGWLGITDKYWLAAIIPDQNSTIEAGFKATASNGIRYQAEYNSSAIEIQPNKEISIKSNLFVGAKEVDLLDYYSDSLSLSMFDRAVDFGWFYIITKPLFQLLHWFSSIFGNVGLSILALTVLIRIALFCSLIVSVPVNILTSFKGKATPILTFLLRSKGLILFIPCNIAIMVFYYFSFYQLLPLKHYNLLLLHFVLLQGLILQVLLLQ